MTWDTVYKIFTLIVGTGIFGGLIRLVYWAVNLEIRIQSIESDLKEIKQGLNGFRQDWNGIERRR